MNCYYCGQKAPAGGLHLAAQPAHGVCHRCGAGVCAEHGTKLQRGAGSAELLCPECATTRPAPA